MIGNYFLTDRKLTDQEFKDKYGVAGIGEEQYHTMHISDGENERQQLIINNVRCIWKLYKDMMIDRSNIFEYVRDQTNYCIKTAKAIVAVQLMICTATGMLFILKEKK